MGNFDQKWEGGGGRAGMGGGVGFVMLLYFCHKKQIIVAA